MTIDWKLLANPFASADIKHRTGPGGKQLPYVTNRAIQERLDTVVGPENWKNEYIPWEIGSPGVLCGLSIRIDNEWVTKWDGAEQSTQDPVKGGFSDAMKRAAVQWGIGRYLYADGGTAGTARQSDEARTGGHAVETPVQPANGSVNPNTAHPPTEKQVNFYRKLVGSSVFTDVERKRATEWLANEATRGTIGEKIDWLKAQVETRKPVQVGAG